MNRLTRSLRLVLASTLGLLLLTQAGPTTRGQAVTPSPQAPPQAVPATKPANLKQAYAPGVQAWVKFVPRQSMKARASQRTFHLPGSLPQVTLPVDNTGNQAVPCPMDGNDQYGDCGEAMAAHADNIYTFRQGKGTASSFVQSALINQYLQVSGGDNGLDEDMVVNGIWKRGIGGNAQAVIVDSLDIDVTNIATAQYALANFGTIQMAWSVPDSFIQNFATGAQFLSPGRPDPANGHYTPLSDIDANGNYSLWTWGSYCWVSPGFVASVQPQCFVVFSPRNFDPATGLDSKGRHITAQAAAWVACGGNPIPQSVIASFPPVAPGPAPTPTPTPVPVPASGGLLIMITTSGVPTVTIAVPAGASVSISPATLTIFGSQSISLTLPPGASISIIPGSSSTTPATSKRAA